MRRGLVVVATSGILACRQVVGITDNPPESLATTACGLTYGTGLCASCAATSCCAQSSTCANDHACFTYESCLGGCSGDPKCRVQCGIDDSIGDSFTASSLGACLAANCEDACGLTCGALVQRLAPPDAAAACEACFATKGLCSTEQACAKSSSCDACERCTVACATPDCRGACATIHAPGAQLYAPLLNAYAGVCAEECAYGANWTCVGNVSWPTRPQTTTTIEQTGGLEDFRTGFGISGAMVCLSADCSTCGNAGSGTFTSATTDDAGAYILGPWTPDWMAFAGGVQGGGFEGCLRVTSPDIVTTYFAMGFPQTQPVLTVGTVLRTITPGDMQTACGAVGASCDSTTATIVAQASDCLGNPAPNVKMSLSPAISRTTIFYGPGDAGATLAEQSGGVPAGTAFIFGVPTSDAGASEVSVTATPLALNRTSSQEPVPVQAGIITAVAMCPTPPQ